MVRETPQRQVGNIALRAVKKGIYHGRLAEEYDGIGQYVLVSLSMSSVSAAYKARVAAGDFGTGQRFPVGTPVTLSVYRGKIEVLSLGNKAAGLSVAYGARVNWFLGLGDGSLKASDTAPGAEFAKSYACDGDLSEPGGTGNRWSPSASLGPASGHWWAADIGATQSATLWRLVQQFDQDYASEVALYYTDDVDAWNWLVDNGGKISLSGPAANGWNLAGSWDDLPAAAPSNITKSISASGRYWLILALGGGLGGIENEFDIHETELWGNSNEALPIGSSGGGGDSGGSVSPSTHVHAHGDQTGKPGPHHEGNQVDYDNTASGLAATEMQGAVDEVAAETDQLSTDLTALDTRVDTVEADLAGLGSSGDFVLAAHGGREAVNIVAASGADEELNLANGNWHDVTLTANPVNITFAGIQNGVGCSWLVWLTQDATGGRTVNWPASVVWPGGEAPTLSTAPGAVDIVAFYSRDGGTTIYGAYLGSTGSEPGTIVDPGTATYDDSNPAQVVITVTSKWGVNGSDAAYFNSAGVTSGEEAALVYNHDTGEFALRPYNFP